MAYIEWNIVSWWTLSIQDYVWTEFQWYRDNVAIPGETNQIYYLQITDQWHEITCAIWNNWEIDICEPIFIDYYSLEVKPIEKEYIVKLYDKNMEFIKVLPASIITNDISFSESIDAWQWEMELSINLPIDTDYFENVRYWKVFVSDNNWINDLLIYSWWLSKISRVYSNNKENIQATFLSLYSLLEDVLLRKNWADNWNPTFSKTWDPANILKFIIDYFSSKYPNTLSYTEDSIDEYWESITIEFDGISCARWIKNLVNWLSYYVFVWADWIVHFHNTSQTATHLLTYEKDITSLTIPEDKEQIKNKVQVIYQEEQLSTLTNIATDSDSIDENWVKEILLSRQDLNDQTSAELYRDQYLNEYKNLRKNITITVNSLYPIETIHPWDTIKIRNLGLNIDNAQVNKVSYKYEKAILNLEYYQTVAQEIFNS